MDTCTCLVNNTLFCPYRGYRYSWTHTMYVYKTKIKGLHMSGNFTNILWRNTSWDAQCVEVLCAKSMRCSGCLVRRITSNNCVVFSVSLWKHTPSVKGFLTLGRNLGRSVLRRTLALWGLTVVRCLITKNAGKPKVILRWFWFYFYG